MRESVLLLLVVALAFMVGFAVRRGGLCAVAAVSQAVAHRRTTRIRMFLVAAAWSGVLIVPLAWLLPSSVSLSPGYPISGAVLFGGALFGLGAYVNGACALGTLAHLSGGETNYAGTVVGVLMGAAASRALAPVEVSAPAPSPLSEPSWIGYLFFALFAALALQAAWRRRRPALERVRAKTSFMITSLAASDRNGCGSGRRRRPALGRRRMDLHGRAVESRDRAGWCENPRHKLLGGR